MDHYTLLGVSGTATTVDIEEAYQRLAEKWNTDKNTPAEGEDKDAFIQRFKGLQEAYETLRNEERRSAYDASLASARDNSRKRDATEDDGEESTANKKAKMNEETEDSSAGSDIQGWDSDDDDLDLPDDSDPSDADESGSDFDSSEDEDDWDSNDDGSSNSSSSVCTRTQMTTETTDAGTTTIKTVTETRTNSTGSQTTSTKTITNADGSSVQIITIYIDNKKKTTTTKVTDKDGQVTTTVEEHKDN